jgi:glycerophosphoryl diester phosphodiesterase
VRINKDRLVRRLRKHHLDGLNVWAGKLLSKSFIEAIKRSDMLIYCWTVNDPEKVKVLIENGIDGVTSDRVSWILNQIEQS